MFFAKYECCSESNALLFPQKLFSMYEIHASLTGCFLYTLFPHNLHIRPRPYTTAKEGHACLPCTSPFPVRVAMTSLHESCSYLQNFSHAMYPSVAKKMKTWRRHIRNIGGWGAKSNQTWPLPSGFVDLCEGGHCHAESTCLLDSC